jgi:hypothetical protein
MMQINRKTIRKMIVFTVGPPKYWAKPLYLHITTLYTACPLYTVTNTASLLNILLGTQEYPVSRLSGRSLLNGFLGSLLR